MWATPHASPSRGVACFTLFTMNTHGWKDSGLPVALRLRLQGQQQQQIQKHNASNVIKRALAKHAGKVWLHGDIPQYGRNAIQQARMDKWKRGIKEKIKAIKIQRLYRGFKGRQVAKLAKVMKPFWKRKFEAGQQRYKKRNPNYTPVKYGDYKWYTRFWKRMRYG